MKLSIKLFIALTCLLRTVEAQSIVPLDSILFVIRENNLFLKNYALRSAALDAYAEGARSQMAPEVGGGLWMVPYKKTEDPRDKGQIMLSVQQKFTNPAKLRANEHYLKSKAAIEQTNETELFNSLRAEAKMIYLEWAILEKKKKLLRESEQILQMVAQVARVRYTTEQGKLGNIYKAEGRLQEVKNNRSLTESRIIQKNISLNRLMRAPLDFRFAIDTSLRRAPLNITRTDTALLAEGRSDIHRIDRNIERMKLNKIAELAQSKPDFNLSFNHMISRGSGMPNQFMLLGMISIPIAPWSSRMYKANIRGLDKEIQSMQAERAALLYDLLGISAGLETEITTLSEQLDNYEKKIIPVLQKNYDIILLTYQQNQAVLAEVLEAWEAINAARMQYLDIVQDYHETTINYERQLEK